MKNKLRLLFIPFVLMTLVGCTPGKRNLEVTNIKVRENVEFGSVYITLTIDEFLDKGFAFGDSVNVTFSNGKTYNDIPFYDGYYTRTGEVELVGYQGYPYICLVKNNIGGFWASNNLSEEDTATISRNKEAKYIVNQEIFSMHYSDERNDFDSDVIFGNCRSLSGGDIDSSKIYRGASPIDNVHKRASVCDDYLENNSVNYVLNLANNKTTFEANFVKADFDSPYIKDLYENNKVSCVSLTMDYTGLNFKNNLCTGLKEMVNYDAPYYVHCTEGKDRTGFVCFLLESLTNASYEEMKNDYMTTYDNYFGLTQSREPDKYSAVVDLRFNDFCSYLLGTDNISQLKESSYKQAAFDYLLDGGLTREEINLLANKISK